MFLIPRDVCRRVKQAEPTMGESVLIEKKKISTGSFEDEYIVRVPMVSTDVCHFNHCNIFD